MPESHESQTSTPVLLEVERFEQVRAGAERVLLRLDGRYGERPGTRVLEAKLFVDDGLVVQRHSPLTGTDPEDREDGWLWRASYEVPASYLTDARTRFALESEPGHLLDLPRPAQMLVPARAVPVSARTAQLARRYAAAVAVLLAAAVAPGGLPAQARDEVLRVHHADGSVAYVSSDGQPVGDVPPEATVVDQTAPADAPAPSAPAPAAPAAPEPQPAATPASAQGDVQQQQQQDQSKPSGAAADASTLAKHAGHKPARRHHTKRPTRASHPAAASLTTVRPTHPAVGARPQPGP
ncbi:MAG TPA: hypothetical protein VGC98_15115, partial [Thermoleophilaceae bacterium]